jgi:radical SAM protein with 4Fe4S-binding SPASM domain
MILNSDETIHTIHNKMNTMERFLKPIRFFPRCALKGINYHYHHYLKKGMYPTLLVYQFTQKCNSRCIMCNIWHEKPEYELNTAQLFEIFTQPLFRKIESINLTGGEVFLRDDFERVIEIISCLPRLKTIGISTNGFLPDLIIKKIKAVIPNLKKRNIIMTVKVSIDGIEAVHNKIRGIPDGFNKAIRTHDEIKNLMDMNVNVGIACLIMDMNVNRLKWMFGELSKHAENISFVLPSISESYFLNNRNITFLNPSNYPKIKLFLNELVHQFPEQSFYNTKLIEFMDTNRRTFSCLAGYKTLYMDNYGNIFPCAILSQKESPYLFGNALDRNIKNYYFSQKGTDIREHLKKEKICKTCIFSCDLRNNLREEFFEFLNFYLRHPYFIYLIVRKMKKDGLRSDYIS